MGCVRETRKERRARERLAAKQHKKAMRVASRGFSLQSYGDILAASPDDLQGQDIALMNLLCGAGLHDTSNMEIADCLSTLDDWAKHAEKEIERNFYRFQSDSEQFQNSEAQYRMAMLLTVIQQDFNVCYNPKLIAKPSIENLQDKGFYENAADIFLQGILSSSRMGSCSSMPVLYVALARRLRYPVKLVAAKGHLFCRWDSKAERLNVEGTSRGVNFHDDEFYKGFPFPIAEEEIARGQYLKSMCSAEELAVFLSIRADHLAFHNRPSESLVALSQACRLAPDIDEYPVQLANLNILPPLTHHVMAQRYIEQSQARIAAHYRAEHIRQTMSQPHMPHNPFPPSMPHYQPNNYR